MSLPLRGRRAGKFQLGNLDVILPAQDIPCQYLLPVLDTVEERFVGGIFAACFFETVVQGQKIGPVYKTVILLIRLKMRRASHFGNKNKVEHLVVFHGDGQVIVLDEVAESVIGRSQRVCTPWGLFFREHDGKIPDRFFRQEGFVAPGEHIT